MNLVLNLLVLWKGVPVLLSWLGLYKLTKEIDEEGNDWTGPAGAAPGVAVVKPDNAETVLAAVGVLYSIRKLLK